MLGIADSGAFRAAIVLFLALAQPLARAARIFPAGSGIRPGAH